MVPLELHQLVMGLVDDLSVCILCVCVNIYLVGGLEHVLFSIYWVDVVTGADDKILCQIVVCLWGKAHMGSAYDFNLLMYSLALRIGTRWHSKRPTSRMQ